MKQSANTSLSKIIDKEESYNLQSYISRNNKGMEHSKEISLSFR